MLMERDRLDGVDVDANTMNPSCAIEPCDVPWEPELGARRDRSAPRHGGLGATRVGAAAPRGSAALPEGELRCGGARVRVVGRTLRLIAWLAAHQESLNQRAEESGQLWLTWKGDGPHSISGDIRTRL